MNKGTIADPSYRISFETDEDVGQVLAQVKQQFGYGAIKMYIQRLIREDTAKNLPRRKVVVGQQRHVEAA